MERRRIVVAGGVYVDIVAVAKSLPGLGEYMYGDQLHFVNGGGGLNQAVAASRVGGHASMIGFVGDDTFGKELSGFLKKENIETSGLSVIKNTKSGTILYLLTGTEERHVVFPGSNLAATVKDVPDFKFLKSDIVMSQLAIPQEVIIEIFGRARKAGATTILNLFPNYEVKKELLKLSDCVILNEVELAFRTGDKEFVMAQHKDLQMSPETVLEKVKKLRAFDEQIVIVTLAERGCVGIKHDELTIVSGIKVKMVDATGAGDCFNGAFITGLTEGMGFKEALTFANCAAALSVQKLGATTSFPMRKEVDILLKRSR